MLRTSTDIVRHVKGALLPKRCHVAIEEPRSCLHLKLYDLDKGIITLPKLVLRNLRDEDELNGMLDEVRQHLLIKGITLN